MIRFPCPGCGKMLYVAEGKGGGPVLCPRCGEQTVAPATVKGPEPGSADEAPGLVSRLFSRLSPAMRWGIGSVAAVGVLGLVLAVLRPPLPGGEGHFDARWGLFLAGCSFALICAMLHGHATGCPKCGRWWSRTRVEEEFVDKEVCETEGGPLAKSRFRTTYCCDACRHRWAVLETEEHKASPRESQRSWK